MRVLTIVGVLLVLGGGYALLTGGVLTGTQEVFDVGGIRLSTQERQSVPPWLAGLALLVGGGLVVAGATRKS